MDFVKNTTADIFPYNKKWTRYHHFCGFTRRISPQDIFINSPWHEDGAAFSILKALKLFFEGANVALLIKNQSLVGSMHERTVRRFAKIEDPQYVTFVGYNKPLRHPCVMIYFRQPDRIDRIYRRD